MCHGLQQTAGGPRLRTELRELTDTEDTETARKHTDQTTNGFAVSRFIKAVDPCHPCQSVPEVLDLRETTVAVPRIFHAFRAPRIFTFAEVHPISHDEAPLTAPLVPADLKFLLSANLGALTTIGYLVLIGIGMLHEVILFRLFGVNVLEWMGPTDFLLVPMRDPIVLLVALAPIPAAWMYWHFCGAPSRR